MSISSNEDFIEARLYAEAAAATAIAAVEYPSPEAYYALAGVSQRSLQNEIKLKFLRELR
jgi:hypothetical protein